MNPSALLLLVGVLACPIAMGVMMWLMNKNMGGQHSMPGPQTPANTTERLAALRTQREALEAEVADVTRLAELEAKREALLAAKSSSPSQDDAPVSRAQSATD